MFKHYTINGLIEIDGKQYEYVPCLEPTGMETRQYIHVIQGGLKTSCHTIIKDEKRKYTMSGHTYKMIRPYQKIKEY